MDVLEVNREGGECSVCDVCIRHVGVGTPRILESPRMSQRGHQKRASRGRGEPLSRRLTALPKGGRHTGGRRLGRQPITYDGSLPFKRDGE